MLQNEECPLFFRMISHRTEKNSMRIEQDFSLKEYNTFHLPIRARWFMEYENEEELDKILRDEYFRECRHMHIGGGSNLLFLGDYDGVVLHSAIKGFRVTEETDRYVLLRVGAATVWDEVVAHCVSMGWAGVENLSHIPGETGAASIQNIGAYGTEIKDVIETVEAYEVETGEKRNFTHEACRYGYRSSIFKVEEEGRYIVTHVTLKLSKQPQFSLSYGNLKDALSAYPEITLDAVRKSVIAIRKEKLPDPGVIGNAGSFFMNPVISSELFGILKKNYPDIPSYPAQENMVKIPAGWLIEQCGFKGKSYGEVGVYDKQALVLVNLGEATGTDIAMLAESIRREVARNFGIEIVPEVKYVG